MDEPPACSRKPKSHGETSTDKLPNWVFWWHSWRWCVLWVYNFVCIFLHVINRTIHLYLHFYVFIYKWHCILNIKRGSYFPYIEPRFIQIHVFELTLQLGRQWVILSMSCLKIFKPYTERKMPKRRPATKSLCFGIPESPGGKWVLSVRMLGCFLPGAPAYVQIQATGYG